MRNTVTMTNLRRVLAQNIKKYRELRGISQKTLAEKAKTSLTYIGTIEIGQKFPSVRMLERIAAALGVDAIELFSANTVIFLPPQTESQTRRYHEITDKFDFVKSKASAGD